MVLGTRLIPERTLSFPKVFVFDVSSCLYSVHAASSKRLSFSNCSISFDFVVFLFRWAFPSSLI